MERNGLNQRNGSSSIQAHIMAGFAGLAESLRQATVQVSGRRGENGSGIIWNTDGLIITNSHVVAGHHAQVQLADGRVFQGTVARRDSGRDLAALRVSATDLPAASIGDSTALRVGELVLAVGHPFGYVGALTTGIVQSINPRWVQCDLRLAPGNSGGPLANARGKVVGINSMIAGGLALAVPSGEVDRFISRETPEPPRLGLSMRPVPVFLSRRRVLGLMVIGVEKKSAAERAGLMIGDILIGSGGTLFQHPDELAAKIFNADYAGNAGDSQGEPRHDKQLEVDIIRAGTRVIVPLPTISQE